MDVLRVDCFVWVIGLVMSYFVPENREAVELAMYTLAVFGRSFRNE